jgi:hypothetical protein
VPLGAGRGSAVGHPYDEPVRREISLLAGVLLIVAGCGSDDGPETPVACLEPPSTYLQALRAAPREVRLAGTTPISGCLVEEQDAGALAQVGQSVVSAATRLNAEVRRTGDEAATVQLGYLIGAVQEAASTTGGIHEDLTLRLDAAANFTPGGRSFPASFERALGQGYVAGQRDG